MSDEREIEVVAREIHAARNDVWRIKRPWSDLTASECCAYRAMAKAALDAIDRVRGVRDDNEGGMTRRALEIMCEGLQGTGPLPFSARMSLESIARAALSRCP